MLPEDFVNRMKEQIDDADEFLASYDKPYIKSLRFNYKKNPNELFDGITNYSKADIDKSRVPWENRGMYYVEPQDDNLKGYPVIDSPGKSPLHMAGAYYIQEASAMISVTKLDLNDNNLKVLDLCAAPGGKTTQIADYMCGHGILVANEIVSQRAKILSENIERMGVSNAFVISEDPHKVQTIFPHFFDRILVDAPCSGEGMFRKHNEATSEWSLENVRICANRQDDILDCAVNMLAPGGKIVYSTCTFSKEEDEECIERFLSRHPEFVRNCPDERIYPHKDMGEGHFAASLSYKSDEHFNNNEDSEIQCNKVSVKTKKKKKSLDNNHIDKEAVSVLYDFCKENLIKCDALLYDSKDKVKGFSEEIIDRLIVFGERIFLAPINMPDLRGVSVLRPGLALGKVIKGRFEPDHAFSLVLNKEDAVYSVDYGTDTEQIKGYLRGNTISYDGKKGWYLICVNGLSLGWGKCVNGVIKNHYPKGLRIQD